MTSGLFIRTIAGDRGPGRILSQQLLLNLLRKLCELRRILREAGCTFFRESPTNQQFVVLDNAQVEALAERVRFSTWEKLGDGRTVIRLVTSWSTTPDDLAALKAALHEVM